MYKGRLAFLGILLSLAVIVIVVRLGSVHRVVFPSSTKSPRFRLAFVSGDSLDENAISEYWNKCIGGMRREAEALNVSISFVSSDGDYDRMADLYESMTLSGMDGMLCAGMEVNNLPARIDAAAQRGIPTICVDGDVPGSARIAYVGTDNRAAGAAAARELMSVLDRNGTVLVLYPGFRTPQFDQRVQGFEAAMAEHEGIEVIVEDSYANVEGIADHLALLSEVFSRRENVVGIFCPGTYMIQKIASLLPRFSGDERIRVVCCDDYLEILSAIEDGTIDATIVQKPDEMGDRAVRLLCDILNQGSSALTGEYIYIDTYTITRDNVRQYLDAEGAADER